ECWSVGVLECWISQPACARGLLLLTPLLQHSTPSSSSPLPLFSLPLRPPLLAGQGVDPVAATAFAFQALDQSQQPVLELEGEGVESLEFRLTQLAGEAIGVKSGYGLTQRPEGNIQEVQVLVNGTSAITFGDVAMD